MNWQTSKNVDGHMNGFSALYNMYICVYVYNYVNVCICTYVCIGIYVATYMIQVYVCLYIHT